MAFCSRVARMFILVSTTNPNTCLFATTQTKEEMNLNWAGWSTRNSINCLCWGFVVEYRAQTYVQEALLFELSFPPEMRTIRSRMTIAIDTTRCTSRSIPY